MRDQRSQAPKVSAVGRAAVAVTAAITITLGMGFGTAIAAPAEDSSRETVSEPLVSSSSPTPQSGVESSSSATPTVSPMPEEVEASPQATAPAEMPGSSAIPTPTPTPTNAAVPVDDAAAPASSPSARASAAAAKGAIHGTVRSENGKKLVGLRVLVTHSQTGKSASSHTSSNGAYTIKNLEPGSYSAHVTVYGGANYLDQVRSVSVKPSKTTSRNFSLTVGGVLVGKITDAEGKAVRGAKIGIKGLIYDASSKSDGSYRIERVRTAKSVITATSSDNSNSVSVTRQLKARQKQTVNLTLAATGTVRGTVTDGVTGQPIAGAKVVSTTASSGTLSATTGSAGTYELSRVPAGSRTLTVTSDAANYAPSVQTVTVSSGVNNLDVGLTVGAMLRVRVFTTAGDPFPVNLAELQFTKKGSPAVSVEMKSGFVSVEGLATGKYTVTYYQTDYDYDRAIKVGTVDVVEGTTVTRDLTSALPFWVIGDVTISGSRAVGSSLRAEPGGVWSPNPSTRTYRWYRNNEPIGGATGRSYTLKSKDAGTRITVAVTGRHSLYKSDTRKSRTAGTIKPR